MHTMHTWMIGAYEHLVHFAQRTKWAKWFSFSVCWKFEIEKLNWNLCKNPNRVELSWTWKPYNRSDNWLHFLAFVHKKQLKFNLWKSDLILDELNALHPNVFHEMQKCSGGWFKSHASNNTQYSWLPLKIAKFPPPQSSIIGLLERLNKSVVEFHHVSFNFTALMWKFSDNQNNKTKHARQANMHSTHNWIVLTEVLIVLEPPRRRSGRKNTV